MAQTYTRQSSFADGDTITAALFNNEFTQLVNAFSYSSSSDSTTGHRLSSVKRFVFFFRLR